MMVSGDGLVFVARRIDMPSEAWQMPQGGIDPGEEPHEAARRELLEETGTDKATFIAETERWLNYDLPEDLAGTIWGGRFRGQTQKWFACRFTGTDADIDIATDHPEFLDWKWAAIEALPDLIVPFKRQLYLDVIEDLAPAVRRMQGRD